VGQGVGYQRGVPRVCEGFSKRKIGHMAEGRCEKKGRTENVRKKEKAKNWCWPKKKENKVAPKGINQERPKTRPSWGSKK